MKWHLTSPKNTFYVVVIGLLFFSFGNQKENFKTNFPYRKAGLSEREAAAHLLSRFTFGAKPGQIDEVVATGLERWFVQQLSLSQSDEALHQRLTSFESLSMSNKEIISRYPKRGQLVRMAVADKVIDRSIVNTKERANQKEYRKKIAAYMEENDLKIRGELYRELISQKILRAVYSNNQLQEVMTSFWFNHFNVSLTNNKCADYVTTYERDVIRPNALGNFETLLLATAKSPAMLTYLDNFKSTAARQESPEEEEFRQKYKQRKPGKRAEMIKERRQSKRLNKLQGLNENYAREIMELHTLGVDGGYTQKDVTEAARILTGWTVVPMSPYKKAKTFRIDPAWLEQKGIVREGDFIFVAHRHDKGEKIVLGRVFPAGGGYEEGEQLIKMLASHPSTARFISTKLARRFVNDNPSEALINKMAKTFMKKDGNIGQVLIEMVNSREFWEEESIRQKIKSPFELAISTIRGLNADVISPVQLNNWITRMGEKMYYYQAPTGFPDNGQFWINTGSLLSRMNFGLALATQRIPGIRLDLAALNQHREPESAEAAIKTYGQYLMPERDLQPTIMRIGPMLTDPDYRSKISMAGVGETEKTGSRSRRGKYKKQKERQKARGDDSILAQAVGILIGSPEYQRR